MKPTITRTRTHSIEWTNNHRPRRAEASRAGLLKAIPLGRLGRVEDVAAAVVFLAGPGAGYMTGCTLHVNGGMHMD